VRPWKKRGAAHNADRHWLYQQSVQDVEAEIDFVEETWESQRGRPARRLREDFCGTANTACEWVRRHPDHVAVGVDLDGEVLDWGEENNVAVLSAEQQMRVELRQQDVRSSDASDMDVILAMNFSYYLFANRDELRRYFAHARRCLAPDGIFFLDAYGGYEAPMVIQETRECDGFTYIWEQAAFNPIDSSMTCHIHFEFPDKSRMERAFTYHWRLWTLPEIRETLIEAGFRQADVYWEGTDPETEEGDGVFTLAEVGEADPGWICYIVAQR